MEKRINYNYVIITGLILIIAGFIGLYSGLEDTKWETPIQIFQSIGYFGLGIGILRKKRLEKTQVRAKKFVPLFIVAVLSLSALHAQDLDYSKQIKALKVSFDQKSIEEISKHISAELQFGPIPAANTPALLNNMVNGFPKLNSLEIINTNEGEAVVKFNFAQLGENESSILFDDEGKITKIEYLEEFVIRQIRAQQALQNSVQEPQPGELAEKYPAKKVEFKSKDGLMISGNLYEISSNAPLILLLHQANYNKYEYADIAPKLNEMGFNVLAIDQRSGGSFAGHDNETYERAKRISDSEITFVEAEQDIEAAVEYLNNKYDQDVIVWGSSYSSALAIFVANKNDNVKGVISFSPGNYFGEAKSKLKSVFKDLDKPFLVTSSKDEAAQLSAELEGIELKKNQSQFIPEDSGFHGSRAIWEGQKGAEEYWSAITKFLNSITE